jgi:hypothetical protein
MTLRPTDRNLPAINWPSVRSRIPISRRPQPGYADLRPTWRDAKPRRIARSLELAQAKPAGSWYVVGESRELGRATSLTRRIAGREIVLWRAADGALRAGPGACPHLGALLDGCPVLDGTLVCRWHGLMLGDDGYADWHPYRALDDGALLWVLVPPVPISTGSQPSGLPVDPAAGSTGALPEGVPEAERPTSAPVIPERPPLDRSVVAVITRRGRCEPDDIIANRLDPWHGAWFHPYSFSHLDVDENASTDERLIVDVTFRLNRRFGVPVRAEFVCPDRRTIVMRIIDGEGLGSVVETHATPLTAPGAREPLTVMTEVTVAYSDRPGFLAARQIGPLLRPAMRHVARRLWVDDLTYAERRYELRHRGEFPG